MKKSFEVLDKFQTSRLKGKAYYFSTYDGSFLGKSGNSDEIRFMSSETFNHNQLYGIVTDTAGVSFCDASESTQVDFLRRHIDTSYGGNIEKGYGQAMGWKTANGQFTSFLYNPIDGVFSNYNDFKNTMVHENHHYTNNHTTRTPENEISAITAMVNDSSYANTSGDHKYTTTDYLFQQWKLQNVAGTPGHTWADACRICKYTGGGQPPAGY